MEAPELAVPPLGSLDTHLGAVARRADELSDGDRRFLLGVILPHDHVTWLLYAITRVDPKTFPTGVEGFGRFYRMMKGG